MKRVSGQKVSIADILSDHIDYFIKHKKLTWKQRKVVDHIINCRTPRQGVQFTKCDNKRCDYSKIKGAPCGDRGCNSCGQYKKIQWLDHTSKTHPRLPYYHTVFTIPSELNHLTLMNQEVMYDILFKAAFETINRFSEDPKYLGARPGYISVLHTWGQQVNYHPHLHVIITAGGLNGDKFKKLPYQKNYLFPVRAMSKIFKSEFITRMRSAYNKKQLNFPGKLEYYSSVKGLAILLDDLYNKSWVIYTKRPFPNSDQVLEYISRYVYRVAISNWRIKGYDGKRVKFQYKNYKKCDKQGIPIREIKEMESEKFIQRFLYHVLPEGFRKIRYGGIYSSGLKRVAIEKIKNYFKDVQIGLEWESTELYKSIKKYLLKQCPVCTKGKLIFRFSFDSS